MFDAIELSEDLRPEMGYLDVGVGQRLELLLDKPVPMHEQNRFNPPDLAPPAPRKGRARGLAAPYTV